MANGYCPNCQTNVITTKKMAVCKIIFWFLCGFIPGIICLIKESNKPENICSNCGGVCTAPK